MMVGYFLLAFLAPSFAALVLLVLFWRSPVERANPGYLSVVPSIVIALSSLGLAAVFVFGLGESPLSPFVLAPLGSCLAFLSPVFIRVVRNLIAR